MKVVQIAPDRSVKIVGYCADFPGRQPGDIVRVLENLPLGLPSDPMPETIPIHEYRCVPVRFSRSGEIVEVAIEAAPNSPPLEHLPGWYAVA